MRRIQNNDEAMPHEIEFIDDTLISVRISGVMKVSDQARLQSLARDLIGQGKGVRLLAKLENFQGWEKSEQWGDASFLSEHGNAIVKMAIVGDERWKDEVFLFAGKGLRTTEIAFFSPSSLTEAEAWVRG